MADNDSVPAGAAAAVKHWPEPPDGTIVRIHLRNQPPLITVRDEARAKAARDGLDIPQSWDGAWWRVGHDLPHVWPSDPARHKMASHTNVVLVEVLGPVATWEPIEAAGGAS